MTYQPGRTTAAFCVAAALAVLCVPARAQLRVATWNISNYGGGRTADIQRVVFGQYQGRSLNPDILMCQEMLTAAACDQFLGVLNSATPNDPNFVANAPGGWARATFVDGADTDSMLFYRTSKVTLLNTVVASVGSSDPNDPPRNTMRYDVRLANYLSEGATLSLYSVHMKSGTASSDLYRRQVEAQRIRDNAEALPVARQFLVGGDFNIQDSGQTAYQELVASQTNNLGRFFDPIKTPGAWNNDCGYHFVHTQDPNGAGGMDDRHDQILVRFSLVDGDGFDYLGDANLPYSTSTWNDLNHSYRAWGNDGSSCNGNLTTTGNQMVGALIAQSVINCAVNGGHLPVVLNLRVPAKVNAAATVDFGRVALNDAALQNLTVSNSADVALWTTGGIANLNYTLAATAGFTAPAGAQSAAAGVGNAHALSMSTATIGVKSGTLTISSNAPDQPVRTVALSGIVYQPGDADGDGDVDQDDLDLVLFNFDTNVPPWTNGDVDGDGDVDQDDLDLILFNFFP